MLKTFLPRDQYFRFNPSIQRFDIDEIRSVSVLSCLVVVVVLVAIGGGGCGRRGGDGDGDGGGCGGGDAGGGGGGGGVDGQHQRADGLDSASFL